MRIVIADANLLPLREHLEAAFPAGAQVRWVSRQDLDELAAAVADADVLVSARCPARIGAAGPRLRLVHVPGAGYDGVDVSGLPAGAIVANTFHHENSIAEYVVATTIMLRRGFLAQDTALRADRWESPAFDPDRPWVESLEAATIGFVGFGHIGARAWERFRAFGARGVAVTRRGAVDDASLAWSGTTADLGALLDEADVVVVSTPLDEATRGIIDGPALARMKREAVLVNVGRGPLVEQHALYAALRDGVIAGAAIDVWYSYPPGGDVAAPAAEPFRQLPNVIMTPHVSGVTRQTFRARADDIAANVARLAAGEPLVNVVAVAG